MTGTQAVPTTGLTQERRVVTEIPGPRSRELIARRTVAVSAGVGTVLPVFITEAGGGILRDVDGNSLIDLGAGIAVLSVGHAAPRVVERVQEQVAKFTHTCFMVTAYEGYVAVCEALNRLTPGTHEKRSALFNSGAEAVENAIKVARAATGRTSIVAFDHAYHGRTNLTMALTAKSMPYKHSFGPFAGEVYRAPMSYPYRDGLSGAEAAAHAISIIDAQVGASETAAVILEPIQGEGGFVVPAEGFLPAISQWCTDNGVVFIADEIQTGFARTGAMFACEHEGVVPDLVTIAKAIAGGLPLAGLTGRAELMDAVHSGGLGGTYSGNPVACAAGLGAIETIEELGLVARAGHLETMILERLREMATRYPVIGEVRGRGAMIAMEFVRQGTKEPAADVCAAVAKAAHAAGVVILTCGTYGNVIRLLPPLVIAEDLLHEGLDVLDEAIGSAATAAAGD